MAQSPESHMKYIFPQEGLDILTVSKILVTGLGPVGAEVAKNLILMGVKRVVLEDSQAVQPSDVEQSMIFIQEDIGMNREEALLQRLVQFNSHCEILRHDVNAEMKFDCVVAADISLEVAQTLNKKCRSAHPQVPFIMPAVFGVCSSLFVDLGDKFIIRNRFEKPLEVKIHDIAKRDPVVFTCLDGHGLKTRDNIRFKGIKGSHLLNGLSYEVTVLDALQFSVDEDMTSCEDYQCGASFVTVSTPETVFFQSLDLQLYSPRIQPCDGIPAEIASSIQVALLAVDHFNSREQKTASEDEISTLVLQLTDKFLIPPQNLNIRFIVAVVSSCQKKLPPLITWAGGMAAMEVAKSLTGHFHPIRQWLNNHYVQLITPNPDSLSISNMRLLVIGCSSIACETLRTLALMGCGSGNDGRITVVDQELVSKVNLDSQSLFRVDDVKKLKSQILAKRLKQINPAVKVEAIPLQLTPALECTIFGKDFWQKFDVVIGTVDDFSTRRNLARLCVEHMKPLVQCGLEGTKGHVEVIVPEKTDIYQDHMDPIVKDIPYCTRKSFPSEPEHLVDWGRNKYFSQFSSKPKDYNDFWQEYQFVDNALANQCPSDHRILSAVNLLPPVWVNETGEKMREWDWKSCIQVAFVKFYKYFNHRAKKLLFCFPPDLITEEGLLFWQPPKYMPKALEFDPDCTQHLDFIISFASLWACVCGIPDDQRNTDAYFVRDVLAKCRVPMFVPQVGKKIETDESVEKPEEAVPPKGLWITLQDWLKSCGGQQVAPPKLFPQNFVKFDQSNPAVLDFIASCVNLRALMYELPIIETLEVKRMAENLVPSLGCTAAVVAGLVSAEVMKCRMQCSGEDFCNWNLNLGDNTWVQFHPLPTSVTRLTENITVTAWDRWSIKGNPSFTLLDFLNAVREKYSVEVTMVIQNRKMIFVPIVPGHPKRKKQLMSSLLDPPTAASGTVVLTVAVQSSFSDDEDMTAPPIYYSCS